MQIDGHPLAYYTQDQLKGYLRELQAAIQPVPKNEEAMFEKKMKKTYESFFRAPSKPSDVTLGFRVKDANGVPRPMPYEEFKQSMTDFYGMAYLKFLNVPIFSTESWYNSETAKREKEWRQRVKDEEVAPVYGTGKVIPDKYVDKHPMRNLFTE